MEVLGCLRCHRRLTAPLSLERGFGPVCWGKVRALYFQRDGSFEKVFGESPGLLKRLVLLFRKGD